MFGSGRTRWLTTASAIAIVVAGISIPSAGQAQQEQLLNRIEQLERELQEMRRQLEDVQNKQEQQEEQEQVRVQPSRKPPVRVTINGHINQAYLYADNGDDSQSFIVDNDNSGSRLGITGEADRGDWTGGARLEVGFEVNSTDEINFGDREPVGTSAGDNDFLDVRHAEAYAQNPNYGEAYIGFGDIATEDAAEVDLSGTTVIMESDVDDTAGGLDFENGIEVDDVFNNLDGFRTSRLAYFSPRIFGVQLGVAGRQEDADILPDVSLNYKEGFGDWDFESAVGWRNDQGDDDDEGESQTFLGSASVLSPWGLNLTVAGGVESLDDGDDPRDDDPNFFYVKGGYRAQWFDIGETRFAVDYFMGENNTDDILQANGDNEQVETESFGFGVVQVFSPLSAELYAHLRLYQLDIDDNEDPDDLLAFMTGTRIRF